MTPVPSPAPRVLFCAYHCHLDPSSGAALATRDLLEMLAGRGWACAAFCGPHLDFDEPPPLPQLLAAHAGPYQAQQGHTGAVPFAVYHLVHRGVPASVFDVPGSSATHSPGPEEGRAFLRLLDAVLDRFRPDVLLTYGGHWLAREVMLRAKGRGLAVAFALHNFAYHDASLFAAVDGVLVPSQCAAEHYRRALGLDCTAIPYTWD